MTVTAARGLVRPTAFFEHLRSGLLGPTLSQDEVAGCEAIVTACLGWPVPWTAYALATAFHETAHTMQPIKEFGGEAYFRRMYDITGLRPDKARALGNLTPGDGARFAGRGYVQLTGRANYVRAGAKLGVDLVTNPDLAMRADLAAKILRQGMETGWFTGKKMADYLPDVLCTAGEFIRARRIINGSDRASLIAGYALAFQKALTLAG